MIGRIPLAAFALACATSAARQKTGATAPFGPAGVTDDAVRPLRHAVLVGINSFQDARFTALRHAAADATDLASALDEFDDVRVLVEPGETTRAAILSALIDVARRVRTPRDTVVLYFSTHGSLAREPGGELKRFLVATDTQLDRLRETGISVDWLARRADELPSRRVLIVLAACHSGSGKSRIPDELALALAHRKSGAPLPLEDVSDAVVLLTASAFGETAQEDDVLGHDVYTHFLLRGIYEGDRDGDGAVTASEAHDFARERTYVHTAGAQRPTSESSVLGKDPIVLRGRTVRTGNPVIYSYVPSVEGVAIVVDGVKKGALPGGVALSPGRHRVRLTDETDGRVLFEGNLEMRPGEHFELSSLVPIPRQPRQLIVELGYGAFIPLSPAVRATLPVMSVSTARIGVRQFPFDWFTSALELALPRGSGQDSSSFLAVDYSASGTLLAVSVARELPLSRQFTLTAGASAGVLWLRREFPAPDHPQPIASESSRVTTVTLPLDVDWIPVDWLHLGLRMSGLALFGRLGSSLGPHFLGAGTARVGFAF